MAYQNNYNQQPAPQNDGALGWDDEIVDEKVLLPDGDYRFEVLKVEKGRFEGSQKMCPCPKAIVTFRISAENGVQVLITENFMLHESMKWKIIELFKATGVMGEDEKKGSMALWNAVIGKTGCCAVEINEYTDRSGNDRENNRIKKYYKPSENRLPTPQQGYTPPPQGYQQAPSPQQQGYQPPTNGSWNPGSF